MAQKPSKSQIQVTLFDTDVLIWYFRGNHKARSFFEKIPHLTRAVSSLTVMELLQGCRHRKETRNLRSFILENIQTVLHPSESISQKAMGIIEQFSISHGLKVIDSLIAATAIEGGYFLATTNLKHYRVIPGLDLVPFKP